MKYIKLTQGKVAIVDDDVFESLNKDKWHASKDFNTYYAIRTDRTNGKRTIKMHREVLPNVEMVDHINGNGLDNRRENLRPATGTQSCANRRKQKEITSSKFKGVSWRKDGQKWRAYISLNKRRIYLGNYTSEIEAAIAYNEAAIKYFGEFASLNRFD